MNNQLTSSRAADGAMRKMLRKDVGMNGWSRAS